MYASPPLAIIAFVPDNDASHSSLFFFQVRMLRARVAGLLIATGLPYAKWKTYLRRLCDHFARHNTVVPTDTAATAAAAATPAKGGRRGSTTLGAVEASDAATLDINGFYHLVTYLKIQVNEEGLRRLFAAVALLDDCRYRCAATRCVLFWCFGVSRMLTSLFVSSLFFCSFRDISADDLWRIAFVEKLVNPKGIHDDDEDAADGSPGRSGSPRARSRGPPGRSTGWPRPPPRHAPDAPPPGAHTYEEVVKVVVVRMI